MAQRHKSSGHRGRPYRGSGHRGRPYRGSGHRGIMAGVIVASWHVPSWQKGALMSDLAILALAGFMFVGLPLIILAGAFIIDRLRPGDPLEQMGRDPCPRKHRPF